MGSSFSGESAMIPEEFREIPNLNSILSSEERARILDGTLDIGYFVNQRHSLEILLDDPELVISE